MSKTLLVDSIGKSYTTRSGSLTILSDLSLTLGEKESLVIMGPSGSGKSTLLNILGTLEPPSAGRVTIEAVDPFALPEPELARFRNRRIGFIFQEHHLLPQCSVMENTLLPTLADRKRASPETIDRAKELLDRVGLSERLEHRPAELSGGERQRVVIARALINRPALLLADEPTGNLDAKTANEVGDLLSEVYRQERCALIVVTHNEPFARRFDTCMVLDSGSLRPR